MRWSSHCLCTHIYGFAAPLCDLPRRISLPCLHPWCQCLLPCCSAKAALSFDRLAPTWLVGHVQEAEQADGDEDMAEDTAPQLAELQAAASASDAANQLHQQRHEADVGNAGRSGLPFVQGTAAQAVCRSML